jgi:hypothetical protein
VISAHLPAPRSWLPHCTVSLSIHAIGRRMAAARGKDAKHATKQVDRLLGNSRVQLGVLFESWVRFVVGDRASGGHVRVPREGALHARGQQGPALDTRSVATLASGEQPDIRCMHCHGRVRVHKNQVAHAHGPADHVEHLLRSDSEGCQASSYYDGRGQDVGEPGGVTRAAGRRAASLTRMESPPRRADKVLVCGVARAPGSPWRSNCCVVGPHPPPARLPSLRIRSAPAPVAVVPTRPLSTTIAAGAPPRSRPAPRPSKPLAQPALSGITRTSRGARPSRCSPHRRLRIAHQLQSRNSPYP